MKRQLYSNSHDWFYHAHLPTACYQDRNIQTRTQLTSAPVRHAKNSSQTQWHAVSLIPLRHQALMHSIPADLAFWYLAICDGSEDFWCFFFFVSAETMYNAIIRCKCSVDSKLDDMRSCIKPGQKLKRLPGYRDLFPFHNHPSSVEE